jgi:hypothetical protein
MPRTPVDIDPEDIRPIGIEVRAIYGRTADDARIVDENCSRPLPGFHLNGESRHRFGLGHVEFRRHGHTAIRADVRCGGFGSRSRHVAEHHLGTGLRQAARNGQAVTLCRAGHHRDLSLDAQHASSQSFVICK